MARCHVILMVPCLNIHSLNYTSFIKYWGMVMSCSFTLDLIFLFPHDVFVGQQDVIVMLSSLNDQKCIPFHSWPVPFPPWW